MSEYEDNENQDVRGLRSSLRAAAGLRFRVSVGELREHLTARVAFHLARAGELDAKVATVKKKVADGASNVADLIEAATGLGAETQALGGMGLGNYAARHQIDSVVSSIELNAKRHRQASKAFAFFAAHLPEEHYDLSMQELSALEFTDDEVISGVGVGFIPGFGRGLG